MEKSAFALKECDSAVTELGGQDVRRGKGSVSGNYREGLPVRGAAWACLLLEYFFLNLIKLQNSSCLNNSYLMSTI